MLRCVSARNRYDLSINLIECELHACLWTDSICRLMLSSVYVHIIIIKRQFPNHPKNISQMSMHLVILFTNLCN